MDLLEVPSYISELVPYPPGKPIDETRRELGLKNVIKLASNENPLGPSPKAVKAAQKAMREAHRYPDGSAWSLKAKLSKKLKVDREELFVANGSNEVIDLLIRTYCVPGDEILTSQAAFVAYKLCAQIQGVLTLETPLTPDYRFDLQAQFRILKENPKIKMVFIANPNNPTGTYNTSTELEQFLSQVESLHRKILVVLDYAYWEYVTAKDLPEPIPLFKKYPFVLILRTFSKVYGLAGLRLGYGIGRKEVLHNMRKVAQPFHINSIAVAAAEAALDDQVFLKKTLKINREGMKYWQKNLHKHEIPFLKSQGNFLLVDVKRGLGISGVDAYQACLKKGVILRPVANYGLSDFLRVSIGTKKENERCLKTLLTEAGRGL